MSEDAPVFDSWSARESLRSEEAKLAFDRGKERAERQLRDHIEKRGCNCDRCCSNEEYRLRYGRA